MSGRRGRSRRLGQHFLVDARAIDRIVEALAPTTADAVVEIGPGGGALTAQLVRRAGRIAAIELDARLSAALRRRFADTELVLLAGDVLRHDLATLAAALGRPAAAPLAVVGNLPYAVSKPVALKLVAERAAVNRAVLMFQREVAARLVASPGGRDYGPLSILCGETYHIERLFDLGPGAFRPRPAVWSSVTRWSPRRPERLTPEREVRLRACLGACFARRRQTLRNNLRAALGSDVRAATLLAAADIAPGLRAEALPPAAFLRLADLWPADGC